MTPELGAAYLRPALGQLLTVTDWWGQDTQQDVLTAYAHHDRLGSIVNLSDQYGRTIARADYREYGEIAFYESITVNGGYRRIAPQLVYTNHEWDDVLDLYYAKARFYDPDEKRFLSMDPVKEDFVNFPPYSFSSSVSASFALLSS